MKPILFNTDMVRAILEGRKTVTRRLVKPQPGFFFDHGGKTHDPDNPEHIAFVAFTKDGDQEIYVPPYQPGDVLYVRETWRVQAAHRFEADARIEFRAGGPMTTIQFSGRCSDSHERPSYDDFISKWGVSGKWHPSLHMPKEAARLFLRVTEVRPERLQDITPDDCEREGAITINNPLIYADEATYNKITVGEMRRLWNSTIKRDDFPAYGWPANPWVWVIEFERCEKPAGV